MTPKNNTYRESDSCRTCEHHEVQYVNHRTQNWCHLWQCTCSLTAVCKDYKKEEDDK